MSRRCEKHPFERAADVCRQCVHDFCARCLVYPFGTRKPPYCIPCAVAAAGVRRESANVPTRSPSEQRRIMREQRRLRRKGKVELTRVTDPDSFGADVDTHPGPAHSDETERSEEDRSVTYGWVVRVDADPSQADAV